MSSISQDRRRRSQRLSRLTTTRPQDVNVSTVRAMQRRVAAGRRSVPDGTPNHDFPHPSDTQGSLLRTIDEDDLCPICHLLLHDPVTTTCNHTTCYACMEHWADASLAQTVVVPVEQEAPVPFDPLEARCPMCRTQTVAKPDSVRDEKLKARYPNSQDDGGEGWNVDSDLQTITVSVGNRHRVVERGDQNQHDWTFFVRPSRTDVVEEVQFLLHPTFRPSRVIRQRPPYEIRRFGWGYFTLVASVILKAGYSWVSEDAQDSPDGASKGMLALEWTLDFEGFDGKGSMKRLRLKVKNEHREWQSDEASDEEKKDVAEWGQVMRTYERDGRWEPVEE